MNIIFVDLSTSAPMTYYTSLQDRETLSMR